MNANFSSNTLTLAHIQEAEANLTSARKALYTATEKAVMLKRIHDNARAETIKSGLITGKNAEEREANLHASLKAERSMLEEAERGVAFARQNFEVAEIHWNSIRYQLRLLEVLKGGA